MCVMSVDTMMIKGIKEIIEGIRETIEWIVAGCPRPIKIPVRSKERDDGKKGKNRTK